MNNPYVVNFFTQRDYERIPAIIKAGAKEIANAQSLMVVENAKQKLT